MHNVARLTIGIVACSALGAGQAQNDSQKDEDLVERCESTDCFNQLRIRDLEIIDNTTLVLYVGAQRCPFLVELTGFECDLTFYPSNDVVFQSSSQTRSRRPLIVGGVGTASVDGGAIEQTRICASDINMGIRETPFTQAAGADIVDNDDLACRIQDVRSITDDERLQIYVDRGFVAPPPPFGTGRVEAPEDPEEPVAAPASDVEPLSPREERRRRREERRQSD